MGKIRVKLQISLSGVFACNNVSFLVSRPKNCINNLITHIFLAGLYGNCWNGNVGDGGQYYGTLAHTVSGKICQPWASQSPHPHLYTSDAMFPHDTSVVLANNYCRDPDFNYRPWCYTMDPWTQWEDCEIPICRSKCLFFFKKKSIVLPCQQRVTVTSCFVYKVIRD